MNLSAQKTLETDMNSAATKPLVSAPQATALEPDAIFLACDEDQDQSISCEEFSQLLDELGSTMTDTRRRNVFAAVDEDRDGTISMDEFAAWWLGPRAR
jgi:hypothetical protein